jgi:addiction module RelE/StbE family toxin
MSSPKGFEVVWTEVAVQDLERIVDFIAADAPMAAQRVFDNVAQHSVKLETLPLRGRIVPELARFEITRYRELLIPPYRLMYQIVGRRVVVVACFDGRRNLEDILLSRLLGA